jgi:hypothetical protein
MAASRFPLDWNTVALMRSIVFACLDNGGPVKPGAVFRQ